MAEPQNQNDLPDVWRALADPTRRVVLDLLRQRPMTTGDLAQRFEMTRFGVMKHLKVLVAAGLVFARRQGRRRLNVLNPIPIRQIHRRWIRPFEAESADAMIRLRQVAEAPPTENAMPAEVDTIPGFQTFDIEQEIRIGTTPDRVWTTLTTEIGAWWPRSFYVGKAPRRFVLEPRVGGRVFEDWGDGAGAMFATIIVVQPHELLQWAGDLSADYGGPARSITTFRLSDLGDGSTLLRFRDTPFGHLQPSVKDALEEGWNWLLAECLKPYAETGRQPERPEAVIASEGAGA